MTDEYKRKFLMKNGWHTWYNENYWVNPEIVSDSKSQDYTNYGMDLNSAYFHETNKLGKFDVVGMPFLSMYKKAGEFIIKIKKHFK